LFHPIVDFESVVLHRVELYPPDNLSFIQVVKIDDYRAFGFDGYYLVIDLWATYLIAFLFFLLDVFFEMSRSMLGVIS